MTKHLAAAVEAARDDALLVDGALTATAATLDLIELLEQAGPYGSGHPSPMFVFPAHRVLYADAAGADHIRCTIAASDGTRIKAIAFRAMGTEHGGIAVVGTANAHCISPGGWWRMNGVQSAASCADRGCGAGE